MHRIGLLIALMLLAVALDAARGAEGGAQADTEYGDLVGRFVYDGDPPTPRTFKLRREEHRKDFGKDEIVDESLLVSKDGGLANVAVYVLTAEVEVHPALAEEAVEDVVLETRDGLFAPRILPVWVGSDRRIQVKNFDSVSHNVNFKSLPIAESPRLPSEPQRVFEALAAFDVPQPVHCSIHPWMMAYVLPRKNPYVAVTGADGQFTIAKLPAGVDLQFQVWHERSGFLDAKPHWKKGRFKFTLKPGLNDLGTIEVDPKLLLTKRK